MQRVLLIAALLLTGCAAPAVSSAPNTAQATQAVSLARSFTYMTELLDALRSHDLACPDYQQMDASADVNVRELGSCSGFIVALLRVDLSQPGFEYVRNIYAMKYPYAFMDANWVVWTDTADKAKQLGNMIGYEPVSA